MEGLGQVKAHKHLGKMEEGGQAGEEREAGSQRE